MALLRPVEIAWVMAAAGQALVGLLGVADPPLLALTELQTGVMRVPWLGRLRNSEFPAFALGLEGIDEEAAQIYLLEEHPPLPGEPGAYRLPHLDEGGYRPGLHAVLRSTGSPVGHALAAAVGIALAREAGGVLIDSSECWLAAVGGSAAWAPADFARALRASRTYRSAIDGAEAMWDRRPAVTAAGRAGSRRPAPA